MRPICITCGTQFSESSQWPESCPICTDERQYVGLAGQQWTTLQELSKQHETHIEAEENDLTSFSVEPKFAIGQRAFLVQTPAGNVLWDCLSLFDDAALDRIRNLGGVSAIAISHPHYYTCMAEWSQRFGGVPIYLHQDDRSWVIRPYEHIRFWQGDRQDLPGGLQIVRCGGHFAGACVLHWQAGAQGKGVLLVGDTIQVVPDRSWVSFMYSYPNYIPLSAAGVTQITSALSSFAFDRIYGAFPQMTIGSQGRQVLERSAERYLAAIRAPVASRLTMPSASCNKLL